MRLPDLVVMVHTKDKYQYVDHRGILSYNKVTIPTVGLVDTDRNSNNSTLSSLLSILARRRRVRKTLQEIMNLSPMQCQWNDTNTRSVSI